MSEIRGPAEARRDRVWIQVCRARPDQRHGLRWPDQIGRPMDHHSEVVARICRLGCRDAPSISFASGCRSGSRDLPRAAEWDRSNHHVPAHVAGRVGRSLRPRPDRFARAGGADGVRRHVQLRQSVCVARRDPWGGFFANGGTSLYVVRVSEAMPLADALVGLAASFSGNPCPDFFE